MFPFLLLCLVIGLILAGIHLVWAGHAYREWRCDPEFGLWSRGITILIGLLFILIVVFWY
jgi:hypothetical protein